MVWPAIGERLISGCRTLCSSPQRDSPAAVLPSSAATASSPAAPAVVDHSTANETDRLVDQLLEQSRCALLLRKQIVEGLSVEQRARVWSSFKEATSLVVAGKVVIERWRSEQLAGAFLNSADARSIYVEPLYIDRLPITNRQYHEFVTYGGYEQESLWQPGVWPRVSEFVDQTGDKGPRLWSAGHYPSELADHPVVGVCWFEADAYARWAGKRLPTDAEWVKAASRPVIGPDGECVARKYPWGETLDLTRVNLWASRRNTTVDVNQFPSGDSVGGVRQLIGNVWEWMASSFSLDSDNLELVEAMKSLRGGAFDTYFGSRVTCQFQSGDSPLVRKRNIGFRCATSCCDVSVDEQDPGSDAGPAEFQQPMLEVPA